MAEHVEESEAAPEKRKNRGATRHCCFGLCNSDSRYTDREHMTRVFWIPFPKPKINLDKCQRWVRACGRENFTTDKITRWTYICSKHFVGGNGPTPDYPDPVPATLTPTQVERFSRKRKAPTPRATAVSKKLLMEVAEVMVSLQDNPPHPNSSESEILPNKNPDHLDPQIPDEASMHRATRVCDAGTQTTYYCSDVVANKIERRIRNNDSKKVETSLKKDKTCITNRFYFDNLSKKDKLFKFYTGITVDQFNHLFNCLGDHVNNLTYWQGNRTQPKTRVKQKITMAKKLSPQNQLLLTLMKLRQRFPNKDLAYRFGVSQSTISITINTWIQLLFKITTWIWKKMFPSKMLIKEKLPACFRSFKNVRVIIDCFEIFVQSSRNFAEQGNMYSSYKNHATLKCLVGISPTGAITFLSEVYEGSISDKDIFVKSGLADLLEPGDLVIADRGFLIKDVLMSRRVDLNIPPFLAGRDRLTPQEEIMTKRIARVRIHVERAIERMKKFKIIGTTLPLSLKPVASEVVQIIGFLVNYQTPLVK